jgi:hypothetical protein
MLEGMKKMYPYSKYLLFNFSYRKDGTEENEGYSFRFAKQIKRPIFSLPLEYTFGLKLPRILDIEHLLPIIHLSFLSQYIYF